MLTRSKNIFLVSYFLYTLMSVLLLNLKDTKYYVRVCRVLWNITLRNVFAFAVT